MAIKHMSILMAQVVQLPTFDGSLRVRLSQEAHRFSKLLANGKIEVDSKMKASFFLLLDLLVFFNLYDEDKYTAALEQLHRTQLLPNTTDEVSGCMANVKRLNGEVIKILPDVMVAAMEITECQYKQMATLHDQSQMHQLRQRAKAISNMAASMPYRLPYETNRRLVQLELIMH